MISNSLFIIILLAFNCLTNSQKVFHEINNLLDNLKSSIIKEQLHADREYHRESKWLASKINLSIAKLAHRTKDVNDLKATIRNLENKISQTLKEIETKKGRIVSNNKLLEGFKKERCENNLIFVKNLRENIEAAEVLQQILNEIRAYFKKGAVKSRVFLEKFEEYSHLLNDEHKAIFTQLLSKLEKLPHRIDNSDKRKNHEDELDNQAKKAQSATKKYLGTSDRTAKEIGSGHIDNNKGELRAPSTPAYEKVDQYKQKLQKEIETIILRLISHLKETKGDLTRAEVKAAEDFAIFERSIRKENSYLEDKIKQLQEHLVNLRSKLNHAKQSLVTKEKLRKESEIQLKNFRDLKAKVDAFYKKETQKRNYQLTQTKIIQELVAKIVNKIQTRMRVKMGEHNAKRVVKKPTQKKQIKKTKKTKKTKLVQIEKAETDVSKSISIDDFDY